MKPSQITTKSIVLVLFLSALNIGALSLDDALYGVPVEAIEALMTDGEAFRLDREHRGILLLPESPMAGEIVTRWVNLAPDVFTEALYLIPYPEGTDGVDLEIYNLTRQVSAISEVIYFSHRKDDYV
jgi:hypothetical protein